VHSAKITAVFTPAAWDPVARTVMLASIAPLEPILSQEVSPVLLASVAEQASTLVAALAQIALQANTMDNQVPILLRHVHSVQQVNIPTLALQHAQVA